MADNSYFDNLYPIDEEYDEELQKELEAILPWEKLDNSINTILDKIWKEWTKGVCLWECNGGSWEVQLLEQPLSYVVVIKIYEKFEIPIYETLNHQDGFNAAMFAAAAMKTGTAKKLTNVFNGDIINIEIKKYGEEN